MIKLKLMKYHIALLMLLSSLLAVAQQRHVYKFRTIIGTVVDKSNQPVGDCTLLFAGTGIGSTTDAKGHFTFHFPDVPVMLTLYYRVDKHKYFIKVNPDLNTLYIKIDQATFDLSERNIQDWNKNKSIYDENVSQSIQSEEFYEYVHHGQKRIDRDVIIDEPVNEPPIDTNRIYTSVEVVPMFGESYTDWNKFVQANLKYPEKAKKESTQGRVIMSFVVERDGRLTNLKIARGIDPDLDKEALRLLQSSGRWKPARRGGKAVRCAYSSMVEFVIQN